jgi:23S rRNA pseudouridine1911/1915/1917 synthase
MALARMIGAGDVLVDGHKARPSQKARAGSEIEVRPPAPLPSRAEPEEIPLAIVHADESVVVVDKPAGLVVHPAAGHWRGTLVNAFLHRFGAAPGEPLRPGIVHRLDKGTSGLIVVTRTEAARASLAAEFAAHTVEREYVAIARGRVPDRVTFDTLYGRHPRSRTRFSSRVRTGKRAVTHVRVLERLAGAALVSARLETGRTHQVRVHLADAGHALVGDDTYGGRVGDEQIAAVGRALGRPALHARVLGFVHPVTGEKMRFEREPPEDFARAVAALRVG